MFPTRKTSTGWCGRRRGLTTFKALWPELRLSLLELQQSARLDWVEPHEDARVTRWARLGANDRLLDRKTA
jgi:hypothetical protein